MIVKKLINNVSNPKCNIFILLCPCGLTATCRIECRIVFRIGTSIITVFNFSPAIDAKVLILIGDSNS